MLGEDTCIVGLSPPLRMSEGQFESMDNPYCDNDTYAAFQATTCTQAFTLEGEPQVWTRAKRPQFLSRVAVKRLDAIPTALYPYPGAPEH